MNTKPSIPSRCHRMCFLGVRLGGRVWGFHVSDPIFYKVLCKRYSDFLTHAKPECEIGVFPLPVIKGKSDIIVKGQGHGLQISRHDFQYSGGKTTGTLKVWRNPYSFDSFFRVFISTRFLREGKGVLVHSAAIKFKHKAYMFTGVSGSGKTTISRMNPRSSVLTDELALVTREKNGGYRVWATPFWGAFGRGKNAGSAPLVALALIRKSALWKVEGVNPGKMLCALLATIMQFEKKTMAVDRAFAFLEKLIGSVKVWRLYTRKQTRFPERIYENMQV